MSLEYTLPTEALEEAGRRLRDSALQERINTYLGGIWPQDLDELPAQPIAVYAPYLGRGSEQEVAFLRRAVDEGFMPLTASYARSRYVTANPALVDCYRAPLIVPKGQRTREWVVPETERQGCVGEAATKYNRLNIVEYWSGIRQVVLDETDLKAYGKITDFSDWYDLQARRFGWQSGPKSPYYYQALMGLYASGRAVLFDTPPSSYAERVMAPAVESSYRSVAAMPLITNVLSAGKRDWVDISYLDEYDYGMLQDCGRIGLVWL